MKTGDLITIGFLSGLIFTTILYYLNRYGIISHDDFVVLPVVYIFGTMILLLGMIFRENEVEKHDV